MDETARFGFITPKSMEPTTDTLGRDLSSTNSSVESRWQLEEERDKQVAEQAAKAAQSRGK